MTRREFIEKAYACALKVYEAGGEINPAIATAQAAIESNFGRSVLAVKAKNLKGVKAGKNWRGKTISLPTREYQDGKWIKTYAKWRAYNSWEEAFEDYARLMGLPWFRDAAANRDDPVAFLAALVNEGEPRYATDPNYISIVWGVVEEFGLDKWQLTQSKDAEAVVSDNETVRLYNPENNRYLGEGTLIPSENGNKVYIRWNTLGE